MGCAGMARYRKPLQDEIGKGAFREELFARPGGESLRELFEQVLTDYEFQLSLFKRDAFLCRTLLRQHSERGHRFVDALLRDVVDHYAATLSLGRTDPEKADLVEFLKSL